jgi:hypothetical protein
VSGRSRAESQVGVRLMGVWRVSYSNIQDFFFFCVLCACTLRAVSCRLLSVGSGNAPRRDHPQSRW